MKCYVIFVLNIMFVFMLCHDNFFTDTTNISFARMVRSHEPDALPMHTFSTHFYTALLEDGSSAVTKWTSKKNLDIIDKGFLLVPVNRIKYWLLCVVINPGGIAKIRRGTEGGAFGIIYLDSLKMHDSRTIYGHIMKWLRSEYLRLCPHSSIIAPKQFSEYCSAPIGETFSSLYLCCIFTYQLTTLILYFYITSSNPLPEECH